jgi:hypothetical protein
MQFRPNSAKMFPTSANASTIIVKNVIRRPNSSRIRPESPFPVATAMRDAIS